MPRNRGRAIATDRRRSGDRNRSAPWSARPSASAASAPRSFFGVVPQTPLDAPTLERMGDANVGTLRIIINWSSRRPERRGRRRRTGRRIDPVVLEAARNGIDILPFIFGTPDWVAKDLDGHSCSGAKCALYAPKSKAALDAWSSFVGEAVDRYGPGGEFWAQHPEVPADPIDAWQIWNEQNSKSFYAPKPDPKRYAKLLKASAKAIHARDKSAPTWCSAGWPSSPARSKAIAGLRVPGQALRRQGREQELRRRRAAPVRQEHQQGQRPDRPLPRRDQEGPRQEGRHLGHRDRRRLGERRQPAQRRREGPGEAAEEDLQVLPQAAQASCTCSRSTGTAGRTRRRASAPGAPAPACCDSSGDAKPSLGAFVKLTGGKTGYAGLSRCRRACGGPRWRRGSART